MGRQPVTDEELLLVNTRAEAARIKARRASPPLFRREEMAQMFEDLRARRAEALADVRKNGLVILQDKFSARGELYRVKVVNPCLAIARDAERQMASLSRMLGLDERRRAADKPDGLEEMLRKAEGVN